MPALPRNPGLGSPTKPSERLAVIDQVRGLVMVLMVLEHALFYFSDPGLDLTDLSHLNPGLFLTEWISFYCAPTFFLLAGMGAFLQLTRGSTKKQLALYLLVRGLLLIVLDMTVVQWGLYLHPNLTLFTPLVLWTLGWSMIAMAALIWLPTWLVGCFGGGMIACHEWLVPFITDKILASKLGLDLADWEGLAIFLHRENGGFVYTDLFGTRQITLLDFPLIPWLGIMALGFGLGPLWAWERRRRRKAFLLGGLLMTVTFVVLRFCGAYGDPHPWPSPDWVREDGLWSALAFLNCVKHPASLQYVLMTLGPMAMLLAAGDREPRADGKSSWSENLLRPLLQIGRVPLFFYLAQWFVLHFLAMALAWYENRRTDWLFNLPDVTRVPNRFFNWDPAADVGLTGVYLGWMCALLVLYPLCLAFAKLKRKYPHSPLRLL